MYGLERWTPRRARRARTRLEEPERAGWPAGAGGPAGAGAGAGRSGAAGLGPRLLGGRVAGRGLGVLGRACAGAVASRVGAGVRRGRRGGLGLGGGERLGLVWQEHSSCAIRVPGQAPECPWYRSRRLRTRLRPV